MKIHRWCVKRAESEGRGGGGMLMRTRTLPPPPKEEEMEGGRHSILKRGAGTGGLILAEPGPAP